MDEAASVVAAGIQELQSLPAGLHWFCPRQYDADITSFADVGYLREIDSSDAAKLDPEKVRLAREAERRVESAVSCLRVLTFDMAEMAEAAEWYKAQLDEQMGRCDICIRAYYRRKKRFIESLREEHDEDDVSAFAQIIADVDLRRIRSGLLMAINVLRPAEVKDRGIAILTSSSMFALFEALSCEAVLASPDFARMYLDEPFRLVQTNKTLKITDYVPAMGYFIFDRDEGRRTWATRAWTRVKHRLSKDEFAWIIHTPLLGALRLAANSSHDLKSLRSIWHGVKLIVDKLDKNLITHCLRAVDVDLYRLALDQLQLDFSVARYILQTFKALLVESPADFWEAMGAISPSAVIEAVCNSPPFATVMREASDGQPHGQSLLDDFLSWIDPFMSSIKAANQPAACRTLSAQLMDRFQDGRCPVASRMRCLQAALQALNTTLSSFVDGTPTANGSVSRVVVSEVMDVVAKHMENIMSIAQSPHVDAPAEKLALLAMSVIQRSLALDCLCFKLDFETLESGAALQDGDDIASSEAIWGVVAQKLQRNHASLASKILIGVQGQVGIETFTIKDREKQAEDKIKFNEAYGLLVRSLSRIFDRLSDFDPDVLFELFQNSDSAKALVAGLYSADQFLYGAAVEVIKIVSTQSGRREAIAYLLRSHLETTLDVISWTIESIASGRIFAPNPRMLKTSGDVLDILCDSQDGVLLTMTLSKPEQDAVHSYWQLQWFGLAAIFQMTEEWGKVNDKIVMKEFCRDTMQFAERVFNQFGIFASAVNPTQEPERAATEAGDGMAARSARKLLMRPASIVGVMVRWLRLRDEFLAGTLVDLVCKILRRLGEREIVISDATLIYIEDISLRNAVRTILSPQQRAQINKALDDNLQRQPAPLAPSLHEKGTLTRPIAIEDEIRSARRDDRVAGQASRVKKREVAIDLEKWRSKSKDTAELLQSNRNYKSGTNFALEAENDAVFRGIHTQFTKARPRMRSRDEIRLQQDRQNNAKAEAAQKEFFEKRQRQKQEKLERDRQQVARIKREAGILPPGEARAMGREPASQAPQAPSMMVSSDSEDNSEPDSDDSLDRELFGLDQPRQKPADTKALAEEAKLRALRLSQHQGPVRKNRVIRNAKDMRARLAPDLSALHMEILSWDFFHDGEFPPGSDRSNYSLVSNTFRTPNDYQATFQPLLILEAWQSFYKAREEANGKHFEIKVASRMTIDAWIEVSSALSHKTGKEIGLGEGDIILLSKAESPAQTPDQAHCMARITKIHRKKSIMEITYRLNPRKNPLLISISPNALLYGAKINSITPLEREYGALHGLQYYDLCDEIIKAKPSPLLKYSDSRLASIVSNYHLNLAQAKALNSALENDGFTLIQGPPGSGKTKTIVAMVGALLTNSIVSDVGVPIPRPGERSGQASRVTKKKLLVCAPSNAAVDELVMRLKEGVKTLNGATHSISIVRLGRSDAINASVVDVTLDQMVSKMLGQEGNGERVNYGDDIHRLVEESRSITELQDVTRKSLQEARSRGDPLASLEREFNEQKRQKAIVGMKIDDLRDRSATSVRDADIARRRAQQAILDQAHVLCATLSGSGHEMLRGMSIEFETVIIDEAAQSIELSALIPLKYGCSKCILVGDPKQLPPTVLSREAARFSYEQSLFVRMQSNHPDDVHLLDTQYRMHPEISLFPSQAFYDGKLVDGPNMAGIRQKPWHQSALLGPYRFFDVDGQHRRAGNGHSLINVAEVHVALQLYERLTTDYRGYDFTGNIGIITPYKGQMMELKVLFSQRYGEDILKKVEFNTTDAFQGRENEIIIFSCVRGASSRSIGFLDDIRRMNVGLTRAKCSLWVLGNSRSLTQNEFWGRLVEDARRRDRYTDGDVARLLQRPTIDPNRAGNVTSWPGHPIAPSVTREIEMPDAPPVSSHVEPGKKEDAASAMSSPAKASSNQAHVHASGGRWGLNSRQCCVHCGSYAHGSASCTNETALTVSGHVCARCGALDHMAFHCTAELCMECGNLGHTARTCTNRDSLSKVDQAALHAQEIHLLNAKQHSLARHKARQLGEHDAAVPAIRTTRRTPPLDDQGKVAWGNAPKRKRLERQEQQHKRKRPPGPEPSTSLSGRLPLPTRPPPTGPRSMQPPTGPRSMQPPTGPRFGPPPDARNGPRNGAGTGTGNSTGTSPAMQPPPNFNPNPNPSATSTSTNASSNSLLPSYPPLIRVARRKKSADLFIKRKPRPTPTQ